MDKIDEMIINMYRKAISEARKPPKYLRDYKNMQNKERVENNVYKRQKNNDKHGSNKND